MSDPIQSDPDRELVEKVKAELPYGAAAYNELVRKHSGRVYGRAFRILRSRPDAEEATQDVFLSVFRSLRRFRFERPFSHWLDTITLNACRMILRRRAAEQRRRDALQQQSVPVETASPPDAALRALLHELLDALEPGTRVAILMRFVEGHSYPEIAEALDLTESAAKMRVSRGAKRLRELYEQRTKTRTESPPNPESSHGSG
jgi:RNA polymerase sigma-70 factor (ECF subfamily)